MVQLIILKRYLTEKVKMKVRKKKSLRTMVMRKMPTTHFKKESAT